MHADAFEGCIDRAQKLSAKTRGWRWVEGLYNNLTQGDFAAESIFQFWISRGGRHSQKGGKTTCGQENKRYDLEAGMERVINIHVERLPEGVYLATTDDVPGLVAQGRTVSETLEIARDVARKLLEARSEKQGEIQLPTVAERSNYTVVLSY